METPFNKPISRRYFLGKGCRFLACISAYSVFPMVFSTNAAAQRRRAPLREAMFYSRLTNNMVRCELCFHYCTIREGERGRCFNKENQGGKLFLLVHGRPSAVHIEPIEKEPSLHMLPGSDILCVGTAGCNFRCRFCHNWHLSQRGIEDMGRVYDLPPAELVNTTIGHNLSTISFTYNEPTSFYEYAYDTAVIAKQRGLKILWHSNGALNPEPARELLKFTDAVTIDLKGFTEEFYRGILTARLAPVLQTLKEIHAAGRWLEIVNLHIPTLNDNPDDIRRMCLWIRENLGKTTPLHFSRFTPTFRLTQVPQTPVSLLESAHKIAKDAGLDFVTIGNVPGHRYNSTFCPSCNHRLIHRMHFRVMDNNIVNGKCQNCSHVIPGIWS